MTYCKTIRKKIVKLAWQGLTPAQILQVRRVPARCAARARDGARACALALTLTPAPRRAARARPQRNPDLAPCARTINDIIEHYCEHGDYETAARGRRHRAGKITPEHASFLRGYLLDRPPPFTEPHTRTAPDAARCARFPFYS